MVKHARCYKAVPQIDGVVPIIALERVEPGLGQAFAKCNLVLQKSKGGGLRIHAWEYTAWVLNPEVREEVLLAGDDFGVGHRLDDAAVDHEIMPVGDAGREAEVLLDQEHRHA